MSTTQTPANRPEKTVDLEHVFSEIRNSHTLNLFDIFDRWSLSEIREKVVQQLLDRPHQVYSHLAGWVEERINQLRANHERDYWRGLLSWYIADSPAYSPEVSLTNRVAARAIEFAIDFAERFQEEQEVAKEVSRRLKKNPELYWKVSSLRRFFNTLISQLACDYSLGQWTQVERSIRRIVQVRDVTYLPQIEKLLEMFDKGAYKPTRYECDEFTFGRNLQFLKDAVRILKQAQQEQTPDLNVAVGSYLREQAGLTGSVIVRLEHPQMSDLALRIKLKLELTDTAEAVKFAPILERCRVEFFGEGFSRVEFLEGTGEVAEGHFSPKKIPSDGQFHCGFDALLSQGSNRFWLTFYDGEKKFAEVARYLIVE